MRHVFVALTSAAVATSLTGVLLAQQPAAPPPAAPAPAVAKPEPGRQAAPPAVKVDIVLSRINGSKTLSSLPYSINVAEGRGASLRLGSSVPIPTSDGGISTIRYQDVGSNIDCHLRMLGDGRYWLELTLEDSSLAEGTTPPVIRSYRISTLLILRNGEATTFNVATDKVSSDTIRAQVTVTALK